MSDPIEQAGARLRAELVALFEQIGADFRATYRLDLPGELDHRDEGDLEDVIFDIVWSTKRALSADSHDVTTTDFDGAHPAIAVFVWMLRPRLDEFGVTPNPLAYDDFRVLIDAVGGDQEWARTVGMDRPLLVLRRAVRCQLSDEVPYDIYREWWI